MGARPEDGGGHRTAIVAGSVDHQARLALSCVTDPGDPGLAEAVTVVGAPAVLAAIADGSSPLRGADRWVRRLTLLDLDEVLGRAAAVGARFVTPAEPTWCAGLTDLGSVRSPANGGGAPIGLWVRGPSDSFGTAAGVVGTGAGGSGQGPAPAPPLVGSRAVAVVGARDATAYGASVAADLGSALAESGVTVVSGGALGIDAAAHRGALAAGGRTVAVLACGVDVAYPRAHADLLDRIADDGWLVSELPPGTPPTRHGFLIRNRLVAALTTGTVVVEAAVRSGALNTAAWAQALLRVVAAVPGPVSSPLSAGCHRLIRDAGAVLVTGADEVLELMAPLGTSSAAAPATLGVLADARDGLDPVSRRVLEAVPATASMSLGRLRAITGDAAMPLLTALGELLELDLVEQTATGWRLSASQRRRRP